MITVGVDLAAQPKDTGLCVIKWGPSTADATLTVPVDDDRIIEEAGCADMIGVDAPFGWPRSFVAGVVAHSKSVWPVDVAPESHMFRLRETDKYVKDQTTLTPLSVSTDRIGVAAIRCARLMARWSEGTGAAVDRTGVRGPWVEVYPKAALHQWGLAQGPYKRRQDASARAALVKRLREKMPWLTVDAELLKMNDDLIDALLSALIARCAGLGLTYLPEPRHLADAKVEGWIHIPHAEALDAMVGGQSIPDLRQNEFLQSVGPDDSDC